MLPQFTTQVVHTKPDVLIIGPQSELSVVLRQLLEAKDLQVTWSENNSQLTAKKWYKVIFVCNPLQPLDLPVMTALKQLPAVTVIAPIITSLTQVQTFKKWHQASEVQRKNLAAIITSLPRARFLFLENLLTRDYFAFLPYLTEHLATGVLEDPQLELSIQSLTEVKTDLQKKILQPSVQSSLLFSGQSYASKQIIKHIQQHIEYSQGITVKISPKPVKVTNPIPFSITKLIVKSVLQSSLTLYYKYGKLPSLSVSSHIIDNLNLPDTSINTLVKPPKSPPITYLREEPDEQIESTLDSNPADNLIPIAEIDSPQTLEITTYFETNTDTDTDTKTDTNELVERTIEIPVTQIPVIKKPPEPVQVEEELQKIFGKTRTEEKVKRVVTLAQVEKKIVKKSKHKKVLFWGGLGFLGIGLCVVSLFLILLASQFWVKQSLAQVMKETEPVAQAKKIDLLGKASTILQVQTSLYSHFFETTLIAQASTTAQLGKTLHTAYADSQQIETTTQELFAAVAQQGAGTVSDKITQLNTQSTSLFETASMAQVELEQYEPENMTPEEKQAQELFIKQQLENKRKIVALQRFAPLLSSMLAVEGKRNYAIVLQNNQELRPTGGFIQAVAVVTIEGGKIVNTQVLSSYEIDSKTSGAVAPPAELTRFLGENQLYFRDSNWNPNFPDAAKQMTWYIDRALQTKIDGLITLDNESLAQLIGVIGQVEVPEFNEVLTEKNLDERLEFHSEVVLTNTDENPDYSATILEKTITAVVALPVEKVMPLFSTLYTALDEQHVLMTTLDNPETATIVALGWSGGLITPDCPAQLYSDNCFVDNIAQVEANVGSNKANYYVEKTISDTVNLTAQEAQHTRTITYKNTAKTNTWPKGPYKTYIRLYVPSNAIIGDIFLNATPLSPESIIIHEEGSKKVIGMRIDVPISSEAALQVAYQVPHEFTGPFTYAFFDQKQPGVKDVPVTVSVNSSLPYTPALIAPEAQVYSNNVIFQQLQKKHLFFAIQYRDS